MIFTIDSQKIDLSKSKAKYITLTDDLLKPLHTICNFGLKKYQRAYMPRNGEYHGFTIEALEDILPTITNLHIENAIKYILNKDYEAASRKISIYDYYIKYGEQIIYYTINEWLKINNFPEIFKSKISDIFIKSIDISDKNKINNHVHLRRDLPLIGRIKIVETGINTNTNEYVVPNSWINSEFANAEQLHNEMNKLDSRQGKPPVTYCCIYAMIIKRNNNILENHTLGKNDILYSVYYDNNTKNILSKRQIVDNTKDVVKYNKLIKLENVLNEYLYIDSLLLV